MAQTAFILILDHDESRGRELLEELRERNHPTRLAETPEDAVESIESKVPDAVVVLGSYTAQETARVVVTLEQQSTDAVLLLVDAEPGGVPTSDRVRSLAPAAPAALADAISDDAQTAAARRADRNLKELASRRELEAFHGIVGQSPAIRRIVDRIRKVAPRGKLTVLVVGETGTGKDMIARAIHACSARSRKPFVAVNCAAIPETLMESQLFGHVRGAFTGAASDQKGLFAAADGGTIFLDEIGDMPLSMQAKLLHVLQHREFTPVGATDVKRVDVRVIAATNADLKQQIEDSAFREDLYYRVHQLVFVVPPLRERREDIPLLAYHFLEHACKEHDGSAHGITSEAMEALTRYYWPGNIRELKSVIEVLSVEVEDRDIELRDLPEDIRGRNELVATTSAPLAGLTMAEIERLAIEKALQATDGNREQAAKMLDIGTRTLYRKIKEYGLT